MKLSNHGGMCCGIKHIFEMGYSPDEMVPYEDVHEKNPSQFADDRCYSWTTQEERVCHLELPRETKLQRLDRYLQFLRDYRPDGIVEITLVTSNPSYTQARWVPVLIERGFREVTPEGGVYNSNSGNRVRVFHLYMGERNEDL